MKNIIVMRTGSAWHLGGGGSNYGDGGDALAVARALRWAGHDVLLLGKLRGQCEIPGVSWNVPGSRIGRDDSGCWAEVKRLLPSLAGYDLCVNIPGGAASTSWPGLRGCATQDFAAKYSAVGLRLLHELKIPRILVVNDPRNYPREKEMCEWDIRPVAVLSQETRIIPRRIGECRFNIHAEYAGCESWGREEVMDVRRGHEMVIVAHSHFKDKRINKLRREVWAWILNNVSGYSVYGRGWEGWTGWKGELEQSRVLPMLNDSHGGPLIPVTHGFITAKVRQYAQAGAIPFLYGRGDEWLTYDSGEYRIPFDDPLRFTTSEELVEKFHTFKKEDHIPRIREMTRPDYSKLYEMVENPYGGYVSQ